MADIEKRSQVAAQCKAVAHLAAALGEVYAAGDGTGRLTRRRGGAMNLWTVGCPDPTSLTAPRNKTE
jgi:hypothetical protein